MSTDNVMALIVSILAGILAIAALILAGIAYDNATSIREDLCQIVTSSEHGWRYAYACKGLNYG